MEGNVEQPVHALDAPMAAHAIRQPVDVERRGGDEVAGVGGAFVFVLRAVDGPQQGLDMLEARLVRIGFCALSSPWESEERLSRQPS